MEIDLIKKKKATIGIFGMGYIGLPRAIQFLNSGFKVVGFDVDKKKIESLKKGKSYLSNISLSSIKKSYLQNFSYTTDFTKVKDLDVIIFCLPTPLKKNFTPDLSYIVNTIKKIYPYLKKNQTLSLESTTYPGTTEEILEKIISKKFKIGSNFNLIYSPERDDPGSKVKNFYVPRLISGRTKKCTKIAKALYGQIFKKLILMSDMRSAEITKLFENIFRSVNIGLVNEMKKICSKMNIDIHEIINAAATKPYGFFKFLPGPGLGGHCIPIDPFYLSWKAKEFNIDTKFIKLAGVINRSMPSWVIKKISDHYKKNKKNINNKKFLILGVAYKKNINDTRESPSFEIMKILKKKYKAKISYHDPYVPKVSGLRNHDISMSSIKINSKIINKFDAVIIVTDHDKFNYELIRKNSKLLIDTRGIYNKKYENIISA